VSSALRAFADGWRRVIGGPWVIIGLVATLWLGDLAQQSAPAFRLDVWPAAGAEEAAQTRDMARSFSADTCGVGWLFIHELFGFGGVAAQAAQVGEEVLRRSPPMPALVGLGAGSLLPWIVWTFLSGGAIDRFARQRPTRTGAFFAVTGVSFFRFVRLGALLGIAYWLLYRWIHPWLMGALFTRLTDGAGPTARALNIHAAINALFLVVLVAVAFAGDLARVRLVVEDRHSAIAGLAAGWRFVRRHPLQLLLLYALNGALYLAIGTLWMRFVVADIRFAAIAFAGFTAIHTVFKLATMAAAVSLFQSRLAHAHYTAAPEPVWPDSPAAEAIANLRAR
jgi:hypothetical protein